MKKAGGWIQRARAGVLVYRDPRIVWITLLGFSSGLPLALTFSTLSFWLVEAGISKTTIGLFASVATPYSLKFLWAPLVDRLNVPLLTRLLGRRRGWLLLTQIALMAAVLGLGSSDPGADAWTTALLAFAVAFCSASQDIVVDAYRVEVLEERQYAAGAAAVVFGYRIGMLVSGAGALYLATYTGWFEVYAVMAALVGVGVLATLLAPEPDRALSRESSELEARAQEFLSRRPHLSGRSAETLAWLYGSVVCPFAEFMQRRGWALILLFVMLYKFGDALAGVMTNPFLLEIGFSKAEIATVVKTYGLVATLVGAAAGGSLMGATGLMRALWICGILQMVSNLTFAVQAVVGHSMLMLGVTIGFENFASGMGTAAFVAYLSSLCNVSYTATQYALLTSVMSVARTWLSTSGGWMAERYDWVTFFIITTFAALPGLALLFQLGRRGMVGAEPLRARVENP